MNASRFILSICILLLSVSWALSMTQDIEPEEVDLASYGKTSQRIHKLIDEFHVMRTRKDQGVNVWVYFNDKGPNHNNDKHLRKIQEEMDPKALWRRTTRGQHIVGHEDQPVHPSYVEQVLNTGVELRHASNWLNAISVTLEAASVDSLQDELRQLVALPFVKSVDVVATYTRVEVAEEGEKLEKDMLPKLEDSRRKRTEHSISIDDYGPSADQLSQINVINAHDMGFNGTGVLVMICDTGYSKKHPAMPMDRVVGEWDFVSDDNDTAAVEGETHGTATLSNLGGWAPREIIGSGFGATFLLAKTENSNEESRTEEDNFIRALEWGEKKGIDLVSSSLGYTQWYTFADLDGNTAPISLACEAAIKRGVVIVISNGNTAARGVSAPADADNVISVGAVNGYNTIGSFSSQGPTADGRIKPDVCARGVDNYVAHPSKTYTTMSGTSFSCPLVAGVVAIILQAHPHWTPAMVKEALITNVRVPATGLSYPNNYYGYGIVDAVSSLQATPKNGTCETLGCGDRGCCVNGACQCAPDYYGRTCGSNRVACGGFCKSRGGSLACLTQASGKSYRCGLASAKVDNITYPTCAGCPKDACGHCYGLNECVGCDGIPHSGAKNDECGVCKGTNQCNIGMTSTTSSRHQPTKTPNNKPVPGPVSNAYYYTIIAAVCFIGGLIFASAILIIFTFMKKQVDTRANGGFVRLPPVNVETRDTQSLLRFPTYFDPQEDETTLQIATNPQ